MARNVIDSIIEKTDSQRPEKNPAAVALGKLGGLRGGRARAEALSPQKRQQIARKAAKARWSVARPRPE